MRVLGLDPGVTSGWCLYDDVERRVIDRGQFADHHLELRQPLTTAGVVALELPRGYGPTRPQMVDCGYTAGRLAERVSAWTGCVYVELERREVKRILTEATQRDVVVTDDATAWAALKLLHGDLCDKKGGALHGVKAHERAALAVCVAFALRQAKPAAEVAL